MNNNPGRNNAITSALAAIEGEITQLTKARDVLRSLNGHAHAPQKKQRKMSAEARRRIAQAQRARWAKWKAKQRKSA